MDTPHLICVIYYLLLFVMLPTTLFEIEMTTLFQDVAYRYTNLRSSPPWYIHKHISNLLLYYIEIDHTLTNYYYYVIEYKILDILSPTKNWPGIFGSTTFLLRLILNISYVYIFLLFLNFTKILQNGRWQRMECSVAGTTTLDGDCLTHWATRAPGNFSFKVNIKHIICSCISGLVV
jgi:hypothetical protein